MAKRTADAKSATKPQQRSDPSRQRYKFALNPYPDSRCSTCPTCGKATGQRKLPLFIHVDPHHPIALNYTCRYCATCNLLIAHQHELETYLSQLFNQLNPALIGNDYLVMGVLPRQIWRENMEKPKPLHEVIDQMARFTSYTILQRTLVGWFPAGVQPPVEPPPPSKLWVKQAAGK